MENNDIRVATDFPQGMNPRQPQPRGNEIDYVELFYVLLSHWWQIILAAIAGGILAFCYTNYRVVPTYSATAKMFVVSDSSSVSSLLTASDLAYGNTIKEDLRSLLTSRELLLRVIDNLHLTRSPGQLAGMISVGSPANTHIVTVTVTSPYPDEAADVANELIVQCRTYLPEVMRIAPPSFYERALVPSYSNGPNYSQKTMMGAMTGAAVVCGIVVLLFLLNDRITTPDDLERYLGVQPLATVPEVPTSMDTKKSKGNKKAKNQKEQSSEGGAHK